MNTRGTRRDARLVAGLWAGGALFFLGARAWLPTLAALAPPCVWHVLTGLPCPTCGATRAALRLASGDWLGALAMNPLAALGLGLAVAAGLVAPLWVRLGAPLPRTTVPARRWRMAMALVLLGNWGYLLANPPPAPAETGVFAVAGTNAHPVAFRTYEEAIDHVRSHYRGERFDTSRSSWITSAEYYPAEGRRYLILGMNGRPYIFARVPGAIWQGFKEAASVGRYYHRHIKGRFRLELG